MPSWNTRWEKTEYPGIYTSGAACRVRVRLLDPRSGRLREANRIFDGVTPAQAAERRAAVAEELAGRLRDPPRRTAEEFGRYWLGVKKLVLDEGTHARYRDALEEHAFARFGRARLDELGVMQVQEWINQELARAYRVNTVKGWFRVLRTMVQDGMADAGLAFDVTRRIRFPTAEPREEANALLPDQLRGFLGEMRSRFPVHYPLAATLALTGLRFCHASALRWEDLDETAGLLRIRRRQLRGRLGPVSQVKSAPKEYPVCPELMTVLRALRRGKRGVDKSTGWMFPTSTGGLRCPSSMQKAWRACLVATGVTERFTVHGLRRTFVDLARRAQVDSVVTRSLTGHVTMKMHLHYSTVRLDEKRTAVGAIAGLVGKW